MGGCRLHAPPVYHRVVGTHDRGNRVRTVAATNVLYVLSYAAAGGLTREAMVAHFDLDAAQLDDVDGRLPLATLTRMWLELPELAGDPDMPLHVIQHARQIDPPLTMLIFLSSATLGEGLLRMQRYQRVTLDVADEPVSEFVIDGERAQLIVYHERGAISPPTAAVIDSMLGILTLARISTHQAVVPLEVTLRHPTPPNPEAYRAAFGGPVRFDADRDRLILARSDLALPHPDASRTLLSIVERHAAEALAQLPRGVGIASQVRRAILERLPDDSVALADVAGALGTTARTLQRRLEAEGTSIRTLVDEARRELALHHIANPRTSLVDIAFRLGFADHSAFTRAFVRWTSRSPSEFRRARNEFAALA